MPVVSNAGIEWTQQRPGVFAGKDGKHIIGRVVDSHGEWDWASYRDGWTRDSGKARSFEDACAAVVRAYSFDMGAE